MESYKPVICRVCGEIDEGDPCAKCKRDNELFELMDFLEQPPEKVESCGTCEGNPDNYERLYGKRCPTCLGTGKCWG
jgi:hypothetical protein